jgi:DNA-binding MarR family transcriptional regulator
MMTFYSEDTLGYWLFYSQRMLANAFYEALKACCQEHEKPYSITPPQWGVLSLLLEQDGVTISSISQRRGVDPPTVTGIVTRLEQHGLVERRHDKHDRRQVMVYLTGEGRDIMQYLPQAARAFEETATRGISQAELQELIARLQRIVANLEAIGPGMGDRFGVLPDFLREEQQEPRQSSVKEKGEAL